MMKRIALLVSLKRLLRVGVLLFNLNKIKPIITPTMITGNISLLAKAFKGFSGIISKSNSVIV